MGHITRVFIVDDHGIIRAGVRALLASEGRIAVVGEATTGREALDMLLSLRPDVIIMDLAMPDLNGIDATRAAVSACPGVKVIGLSASADEQRAVAFLQAGAVGFVRKDAAFEELRDAITTVTGGKIYCDAAIIDRFRRTQSEQAAGRGPLTPRERELVQLIAEGKTTKEIAGHLGVSVKTVETHRRNVMLKLDAHSVADLTKYAVREGLSSL